MILQCSLQATYPDFTLDLAFTVQEGDLVCIIGPSGCGKSTTLAAMVDLINH
ncbi:MAG TPA: ATP-binding cassette domain-containing protein, partial [Sphaerochaeta sp.]|nr:ATP-binding cassette domain-containing protein [Sphaerochaeta sp.]